jgi:hypothetical protein
MPRPVFVFDLIDEKRLQWRPIYHEFTHESLALAGTRPTGGRDVLRVLEESASQPNPASRFTLNGSGLDFVGYAIQE